MMFTWFPSQVYTATGPCSLGASGTNSNNCQEDCHDRGAQGIAEVGPCGPTRERVVRPRACQLVRSLGTVCGRGVSWGHGSAVAQDQLPQRGCFSYSAGPGGDVPRPFRPRASPPPTVSLQSLLTLHFEVHGLGVLADGVAGGADVLPRVGVLDALQGQGGHSGVAAHHHVPIQSLTGGNAQRQSPRGGRDQETRPSLACDQSHILSALSAYVYVSPEIPARGEAAESTLETWVHPQQNMGCSW